MTTLPVLIFYRIHFGYTDASNQGKWAVLSQIQSDGQARVIAYASHLLSKSERHYCIVCKELLALIILNQYLLKRKFNL